MRQAFTVIELLIVLTIIAIIAALLLPAIAVVKASANTTKCLSNQRQVGMAMQAYGDDNRDQVPPSKMHQSWTALNAAAYPYGVHWHHLLLAYEDRADGKWGDTKNKGVTWGCPVYQAVSWNPGWSGFGKNYNMNLPESSISDDLYSANQASGWSRTAAPTWPVTTFRWSALSNVSSRILIGDSRDYHLIVQWWNPTPDWPGWSGAPDRHRGRANYLFCDFHALSLDPAAAAKAIAAP